MGNNWSTIGELLSNVSLKKNLGYARACAYADGILTISQRETYLYLLFRSFSYRIGRMNRIDLSLSG